MSNQNSRFKINFSFGYILKNIESDVLRFFHPSYNNHCVLNTAKLISSSDELSRFLETISEFNFPTLNLLHKAKPKFVKAVINNSSLDFIHCLADCCHNLLKGNIQITKHQKKRLEPYRGAL